MAKHKRNRYFIDKKLQTKYIVLTIMTLMIYTLLFVVILLAPYFMALSFDAPIAEQREAAKTLLVLHKSIWPALGAVMLIMAAGSVLVTHKMAGPIYRFKKVLGEVSAGNLDLSIRLRDKDDFKDLAESMNVVLEELRTFAQTLRGDDATMSACIKELERQIKSKQISSESGTALIEQLQAGRTNISKVMDKYSGNT
jgi:methyl-accepting chemotaxis protein